MGALKTKILSYSPEQYYPNDAAYTGTTLANSGSGGTAAWTVTNAPVTLNATGGPDGSGCWQFSTNNTAEQSIRIFGSTSTNAVYGGLWDGDYSSGFWFRVPVTISGSTESVITLGRIGGGSSASTVSVSPSTGKGQLSNPSYTTPTRIDDGLWHYYAERHYTDGTNYWKQRFLDGSLIDTIGVTYSTSTLSYLEMADNSITNSTGTLTYIELAHMYYAPSASITATDIQQIWTTGTTGGATNITITETPATATALQTEPTIAVTAGDHTEITTSILVSAEFPSNIVALGQKNVNNVITDILTASVEMINNVDISTGTNSSFSALEMIATALLVEPVLPQQPMTASATMPGGTASVTPSYYSLVKSLNPVYYTELDDPTIVNKGSWTIDSYTKGSTVATEQASGGDLGLIGQGQSWKMTGDYNNAPNYLRVIPNDPDNTIYNLEQTQNFTIEYWFKPMDQYAAGIGVRFGSWKVGYDRANKRMYAEGTKAHTGWDNPSDQIVGTSYSKYMTTTTNSVIVGDWNYVAFTVSGDTAFLFINNSFASMSINPQTYNPINLDYVSFFASELDYIITGGGYGGANAGQTYENNSPVGNTLFDELVIYPNALTNSQTIDHYSFIYNQDPNRTVLSLPFTASSESGDHNYLVTSNSNIAAATITASALIVNPTVIAVKNINYQSDTLTASAENTNVSVYWGWTIYPTPATAYAERPATYFLNDVYYQYVQSNFAPYRYVTFDSANAELDYGTDADYSVSPTTIGGTIVNPDLGINGKSVKTAGTSYITDGVILNESEWNDSWGTGANSYHSSFWFQRALDDNSTTGLRVLWNLNGYKDNQHVVLYQYQNKLTIQFNNGSGTHIEQSTGTLDLFDYNRHFVLIQFDHTNPVNNSVKLFVDAVLVMTVSLGSYTGTTTNASSADSGPNNEANNHPRLSVGCLITPFGSTALPVQPTNTKLIIDEIYWDKNPATQTEITNLYAAMPDKTNKLIVATAMTASDELVMPTFATSSIISTSPFTASIEVIEPATTADKEIVYSHIAYTVTAEFAQPSIFENKIITSDIFIATAVFNDAGVRITIPGGTFIATAKLINNYLNGIIVSTNTFDYSVSMYNFTSPWAAWLRATEIAGIYPTKEVV